MSYSLLPLEMESPTPQPSRRLLNFLRIFRSRLFRSLCMTLGLLFTISTLLWTSSPAIKNLPWNGQLIPSIPIPNRTPSPKSYLNEPSPPNWSYRQRAVKEAFLHAYTAYREHAFPADEYFPLSGTGRQNFNGWGVSVVDSMDTMYLMGLHKEFNDAVEYVSTMTFDLEDDQSAHFFETVIRYLGGLLSAYALSKDPLLLQKADELGMKLLPAFNTKSGLPARNVQIKKARPVGNSLVLLAEIASCQLEYRYLAHLTGKDIYYEVVNNVNDILENTQDLRNNSLWPSHWETSTGLPVSYHLSIGAWADSAYEYLLKQYLQTGKTEPRFKKMYMKAMQGVINNLVYLSPTRDLLYVTNTLNGAPSRRFEHLSCFFPGLLALGAKFLDTTDDFLASQSDIQLHEWVAEGIAYSCYVMYAETMSGMGPEEVVFSSPSFVPESERKLPSDLWVDHFKLWKDSGSGGKPPGVSPLAHLIPSQSFGERKDYLTRSTANYMRPETIESLYIMWKTTKDPIWRERGWEIFKSIERNCRLHAGYASIATVNLAGSSTNNLDDMPSFTLAETWKYLYLLFSPDDTISLESWVFNTEAHPLPVFDWSEEERTKYHIRS